MATYSGILPTEPTTLLASAGLVGEDRTPEASAGVDVLPSLVDLAPPDGDELRPDGTIAFTLLDVAVAQLVLISFEFQGNPHGEEAFRNGAFVGRYIGVSESYAVAGGTRYVFTRAGRWPQGTTTPRVIVVDSQGEVRYL